MFQDKQQLILEWYGITDLRYISKMVIDSPDQSLEHLISNKFIRRSTLEHEVVSRPYGDSQELSTKFCELL